MDEPRKRNGERHPEGRLAAVAWIGLLGLAVTLFGAPAGSAQEGETAPEAETPELVEPMPPLPADDNCAGDAEKHLLYQLSYIESDRGVALLCALGYPVTAYSESDASAGAPANCPDPVAAGCRPTVLQLLDSKKVSFTPTDVSQLGGRELGDVTAAIPQQRLLIQYKESPKGRKALSTLLELLHGQIDVPAKQILIEALVIELDRDRLKDLGFGYTGTKDGSSSSFGFNEGSTEGSLTFLPFTFAFQRPSPKTLLEFTGRLAALVDDGEAAVLSRPSILVLDGRQARIFVGDMVPYANVTTTDFGTSLVSDTKYIDVGITLNLRPRASDDNSQVTMQVETLIASSGPPRTGADFGTGPDISSREVTTSVRVANNTPFIIGGLISKSESERVSGIPGLSKIPGIGRLFRRNVKVRDNKEVIVVIVPHVIPPDDRAFSYTIAKDSDLFNQFDLELFRNVYRVRSTDVFDLDFIRESAFYQCIERTAKRQSSKLQELFAGAERKPVVPGDTAGLVRALRDWARDDPESLLAPIVDFLYQHHFGDYLSAAELSRLARLIRARVQDRPEAAACWKKNLEEALALAARQGPGLAVSPATARGAADAFLGLVDPPEELRNDLKQRLDAWAMADPVKLLEALRRALDVAGVDASVVTDQVIRLLDGRIPGESILVKRMLLEIVEDLELGRLVDDRKIIFYEADGGGTDGGSRGTALLDLQRLVERIDEVDPLQRSCNTVGVLYETGKTSAGMIFDPPSARLDPFGEIENERYVCELRRQNCLAADGSRWDKLGVLLNACYEPSRGRSTLDRLKSVLVLKRVLDLNPTLPLTLEGFHVGLDVVFPTEEDLRNRSHLADREAAELFFEVVDHYYAFELAIRNGLKSLLRLGLPVPPGCEDASGRLEQSTSRELDPICACAPAAPSIGASCPDWRAAAPPPEPPGGQPAGGGLAISSHRPPR